MGKSKVGTKRESLLEKYTSTNQTTDSVNEWLKQASTVVTELSKEDASKYSTNWGGQSLETANKLRSQAKDVWKFLYNNKDNISNYKELDSLFGKVNSALTSAAYHGGQVNRYFSQFESEDAYKKALKDYEHSEYLKTVDINELSKQIEDAKKSEQDIIAVQNKRDEIYNLIYFDYLRGNNNSGYNSEGKIYSNDEAYRLANAHPAVAEYDRQADEIYAFYDKQGYATFEDFIADRQQDYNLAKHIQNGIKLAETAQNAEDFDAYSILNSEYSSDATYKYINNIDNFRDTQNEYYASNATTTSSSGSGLPMPTVKPSYMTNNYDYMTDEEVATYNYYYTKFGRDKAQEYLDSIKLNLNTRSAMKIKEQYNDVASQYVYGVVAGLDQFTSGVANLFNTSDDYIVPSDTQLASGMIREELADKGPEFLGQSIGQAGYDLITTTSNMMPSILTSSVVGMINPTAGAAVGAGLLGGSSAGNAYAEMINLGYNKDQARGYSALVGVSEAGLQYALGGISKLGGSSKLVAKIAQNTDKAIANIAINFGGSLLSEFTEEYLQEVLTPVFKNWALGADEDVNLLSSEALYSGILGALTAGVLEGPSTIAGGIQTYNNGVVIKNAGQLSNLTNLSKSLPVESVAYQLADKVNETTGAYAVGRLLNEAGAALSEANITEITNALESRGMTSRDANAIAKWLNKAVEGEYFSEAQQKALEENPIITEVFKELVFNQSSNVNKRTQEYQEILREAAEVRAGVKAQKAPKPTATEEAKADTSGFALLSNEEVAKRMAEDPHFATDYNAWRISQSTEGKLAPESKNVIQSKYETNTDGETINTKKGENVKIVGIASIKDGEMTLKVENSEGETEIVNAKDLSLSESDALIYSAVVDMGASPASAWNIAKNFKGSDGVSAEVYAADIPLAYKYGVLNYKEGLSKLDLTTDQAMTAFYQGRNDSDAKLKSEAKKTPATASKKKNVARVKGKVIFEGFEYDESSANDLQKASMAGINLIAKMSSLEVHVYKSFKENGKLYTYVDGKKRLAPNGYFKEGANKVYIDLNAGMNGEGLMLDTLAHEISHYIAEWNWEGFKELGDFLFEHYGENVPVDELINRQKQRIKESYRLDGKPIPSEDVLFRKAYEETVADAMTKMLSDENAYLKLAELKKQNKTLWEKIGEAIKNLLDKFKSLIGMYSNQTTTQEALYVEQFSKEVFDKLQDLYIKAFVKADENFNAIGARNFDDFSAAKNTDGESLFQYRAMEADEAIYRDMLLKWGGMSNAQIDNLFTTIDRAMDIIKGNLEVLDYAWEADIDDRAFSPVKPNSDSLYQVSLDFSTLCRKRILQQTIITHLQEALNQPISREEGIAIRDALIALQEEGRQIEVACALCYVESARMKSPEQIRKFLNNREAVIKDFFAGKSGGSIKGKIKQAEIDARENLHKENPNGIKGKDGSMVDPRTASLKAMSEKYADAIRAAKKSAKESYKPTAEEQKLIDVAKGMTISDFTSSEGLENLAKNYPALFDAYTSYVRNATKSKGIEGDTWWRAGDSAKIGDTLIANMNRENGLRSQSWSDFQVIHILDYIAATIELSTRNAKEQAYSKVPDYIELMGQTGVMLNMSLIPTRNFNGFLDYDSVEGMAYKKALELRNKYPATAGTICIGINNEQIKMLLADSTIDYVIPYHKSGMAAAIRKKMHIPTWDQYEEYQSEKNLSDAEAKKNAEKYGVKLLDKSDPNYQKHTSFSEWFDLEVAKQIAKMENANPSNKAMQKKYGVMYGGYMAMQNAANNYLKLCAERGLSPKFSHKNADFTGEDNYWKLLIDRKMVNNATGEIIEQQAIKPIFDEGEILRILNDELERYPTVKADQDYATRTVTEKFLSGEIKSGMSAKAIAEVMKKPVDNITTTNILASAEDVGGQASYTVDLTDDTNLSKLVDGVYGAPRYKTIANYIMNVLGDELITLSDGREAIVDNRDALHIANHAKKERTAQIAKIKEIIENAQLYAYDNNAVHNKFSQFLYYKVVVKYNNEQYPLYVNVGLTKNDKTYHIYDITKKIRDTANRINGLERPSIDEGNTLRSDISNNSIPHYGTSVNTQGENSLSGGKSEKAASDFVTHIRNVIKERGSWRTEDATQYVAEHSSLNFIERIYKKDKAVKADLAEFLGDIDDVKLLESLSWFMGEAYADMGREFNVDTYKTSYPYRGAVRIFRNAIKNRINDIMTAKVNGTNLGVSNGRASLDDVKSIFNRLNSNEEIGKLADKVFETAEKLGVNIQFVNQTFAKDVAGDSLGDMVEYKTSYFNNTAVSDQSKASTILHELIHSCTVYVMVKNTASGDVSYGSSKSANYTKIANAATRLNRIYAEIKDDPDFAGRYGIKNSVEMVAELSDENFVGLLKKKNLWDKIVDWICEFFGFSKGTSAYDNAMQCLDYILDNPEVSEYKRYAEKQRWSARRNGYDVFGSTELEDGRVVYQDRDSDSVSNRSLLANSLESAAQNDIERNKLALYKEKISLIEAEEQKLSEIQKQLFTKDAVDPAKRKELQFEAKQISNRINTYDRQLLNLEATTALKNVLNREKALAMKRQKQKDAENLKAYKEKVAKTQRELLDKWQDSRKKAVEGRNKTAMRHKIKGVVGELNQLLLRGTKDKHVMIGLQKAVAEALDAVNMDTVGADERVAKYNALIAKAKDPDVIASLTETRDRIQGQGDKMNERLTKLKNAYNDIKNSDDPLIANSYDEVITSRIEAVIEKVGNTPLRDMTLEQLEDVYDMYKMVLTVIRNSNKAFKSAKNESIATLGNRVMMEVEKVGGNHPLSRKALEGIKSFEWNSLKPIYAFRVIGSNTLTDIYNNVRAGEDTWARDVNEARDFYREKTKKYNFDSWDFKKTRSFTSTSGKNFELSLEQIMSLYAYSKREQADLHLQLGGFVFDSSIEVTKKSKLGIPLKYTVKTADAYNLSKETLGTIIGTLSEEQKAFVDEMQSYLSTVMGEKGNEVSLEMYGVKLFKEKNYFPLKSAKQFMFEQSESAGEVRIKNSGFSKETVAKANNPIILNNFTDVWTNHVNDMSMYHAFVLALEDFNRVYNYKTPTSDNMATESVKMFLQNAYGNQASQYIKNLITDLNGGVRVDPAADPINKGIGAFKKAAVFASASVVIQQPSAIARALAYIDSKYFVTRLGIKDHSKVWSEVKKYAPVAIIKEMGRFDTHIGQQTTDWIKSTEYKGIGQKTKALFTDSAYRDDLLSRAPALADEIAWCYIWNAVKKETKATTNLQVGSKEFMKKCGERFTEIVTLTQVYDSVLSRSAHMRSKDTGMKMATSFMAEPTTAMNMAVDAVIQGKRGNKKFARKAVGAVAASIILNSILVSLVYAGRDDDEDETYAEKYIGSLTSELLDGFNPLTYIPFVKDIWSIAQGYDVERSDMSLYSKLWQSVENLFKDDMSAKDKVIDFAGTVANLFGLPLKNITRDVEAMFNLTNGFMSGTQTTKAGIVDSVEDSLRSSIPLLGRFYEEDSNATKLYDAIISGDEVQIERVKSRFKDDKAIETALRKALRENDPRIIEAAQARNDGDIARYTSLVKEIKAEGHFKQDTIVAAINAERDALRKGEGTVQTPAEDKEASIYKLDDLFAAVASGDRASAKTVRDDMIRIDVANGKSQEDAEENFNGRVTSRCREEYEKGSLTGREAEDILVNYGGKTEKEATNKVLYWDFKEDYPDVEMSEEALVKYYDQVESSGISMDVYVDYYEKQKECKGVDANKDGKTDSGSKKAQVLKVINSLPISKSQKDALYYLNGWAKSTLHEAPWR